MDYFRRFNFLFAAPIFDAEDLGGLRFNQIVEEIQRSGFEVIRARRLEDAEIAVQTDAAIGCMLVDWGKKGLEGKTVALINLVRRVSARRASACCTESCSSDVPFLAEFHAGIARHHSRLARAARQRNYVEFSASGATLFA